MTGQSFIPATVPVNRASMLTPRQRALSLAAVISASFGVGVALGIGFPLSALTLEAWGEPKWIIGLAGAVPAVAILVVLTFAPRLAAKTGPVFAISSGCFAGALGFMALYAYPSAWAWIVIRFFMSAGFAMPWLAGETWINTVAGEKTRGRVIAIYGIAFFSGFSLGPIILDITGLTGPAPFLVGALGTALAGIPIILARNLAPDFCHDGGTNLLTAMRHSPVAMISAFIGGFAEIGVLSLIPNVALAAGQTEAHALYLLTMTTVGGCVLQFPIGWLSDTVSRYRVTVVLAIAFMVLMLMLPFVLRFPQESIVAGFLIGGSILGFYTVGLAIIGERVPLESLAAANAAYLVLYQLGGILGPLVAGVAMSVAPVEGFVGAMTTLMAVSLFLIIRCERSERRKA